LYEVAQQLLTLDLFDGEHKRILTAVQRVFDFKAACIFDAITAEAHTIGDMPGEIAELTRAAYIGGKDYDEPASNAAFRCLRVSGKVLGAIGFMGLEDVAHIANPLGALAAAGLERAEAVRRAGNAAAEAQAESLRAAILDALAHEFKTPLATILTAAGGLREAGPLASTQAELADLVEAEAERLSHLSSRLLRLAKLDGEDVKPRMEPVNLVPIVSKIVERYARQWPERQFLFDQRGEAGQILADGGLVQLAIGQLVDNACRYSPLDSAVKVSVEFEERCAAVVVWNSGEGIPSAEAARIFDRFFRGAGAQQVSSGSGLGLYVARKIAVAHGGSLDLDYNRDVGGVAFRFKCPLVAEGS
jgi:two-component system sensor histidine kinase KdpD